MAFVDFNGVKLSVESGSFRNAPVFGEGVAKRRFGGWLGVHNRYGKPLWSGNTVVLLPDDSRRVVGFLDGAYDMRSYESTLMLSSRYFTLSGGTRVTSAPKFGTANLQVASATTATLLSNINNPGRWGVFTYKKDASGAYTSWTNIGYRASDGAVFVNGVLNGSAVATNWLARSGANLLLRGKNDAGTDAVAQYDNTVICWFDPSDEMMATWSAADYEWPSGAPYWQATGNGLSFLSKGSRIVRAVPRSVEEIQVKSGGVWYHNASKVEFDIFGVRGG